MRLDGEGVRGGAGKVGGVGLAARCGSVDHSVQTRYRREATARPSEAVG